MHSQLSQADIANLIEPGMYRFDRGLFLQVKGPDSKSWIYRYTVDGTAHWKGIGPARDVTLARARKEVERLRVTKVAQKIDPVAEEERRIAAARTAEAKAIPFRVRAEEFIAAHEQGWRNDKHRAQWRSSLEHYVFPIIGDIPAHLVTGAHMVEILRPIWIEKPETARRVRGRVETILDYAADPDDTAYRNPATLTAQLLKKLPKAGKRRRVVHHASLPYEQIGAFLVELRAREGMAAKALEFAILTTTRTNEVIGARWNEIDRLSRMWTIPADRMKGSRVHRVPLSVAALTVLDSVSANSRGKFVFPAVPTDEPMSNMAMLAALKRMGRSDVTTHGFRSTFRTWAAEQTNFPREVAEAALAHVLEDKTEAAYQRGDLLEKRRKLMEAWAAYCDKPPASSGEVIPLRA